MNSYIFLTLIQKKCFVDLTIGKTEEYSKMHLSIVAFWAIFVFNVWQCWGFNFVYFQVQHIQSNAESFVGTSALSGIAATTTTPSEGNATTDSPLSPPLISMQQNMAPIPSQIPLPPSRFPQMFSNPPPNWSQKPQSRFQMHFSNQKSTQRNFNATSSFGGFDARVQPLPGFSPLDGDGDSATSVVSNSQSAERTAERTNIETNKSGQTFLSSLLEARVPSDECPLGDASAQSSTNRASTTTSNETIDFENTQQNFQAADQSNSAEMPLVRTCKCGSRLSTYSESRI